MKSEKCIERLDRLATSISRHLEWAGVVGLLIMFIVNLLDVLGAKLLKWPFPGATELIGFSQIIAIASAMAFTLILGRHIRVEFVIERFSRRVQAVISGFSSFLSLILFILLTWQSFVYGQSLQRAGEIGSTSYIPFFPFAYFIALCSIPVCFAFLVEVLKSITEVLKNGSS